MKFFKRNSKAPDHIKFDPWEHSLDERHRIIVGPTQFNPDPEMSAYKNTADREPKVVRHKYRNLLCCYLVATFSMQQPVKAVHHMKRAPVQYVARQSESEKPLVIQNLCKDVIYPGIVTQAGDPPSVGGFRLNSGERRNLTVSADWQGRVWGRTNCSFNSDGTGPSNRDWSVNRGRACLTGDCGGIVNCRGTGEVPVSLAEFTLASSSGQAFYDISLVDGYNIPMAIISLYPESGNSSLQEIPPNLTNPICIGTSSLLADQGDTSDAFSGTNASFPIPLDQSNSKSDVQGWCPWDLLLRAPTAPRDGIYRYPDDNLQRPIFNACFSACSKYNKPSDCCTGYYNDPDICKGSKYSRGAKMVCPDAYSFAFDDQTSTFIIPSGGGFEVTFCPVGRSSNILAVYKQQLSELAQSGRVRSSDLLADTLPIVRSGAGRLLDIERLVKTGILVAIVVSLIVMVG